MGLFEDIKEKLRKETRFDFKVIETISWPLAPGDELSAESFYKDSQPPIKDPKGPVTKVSLVKLVNIKEALLASPYVYKDMKEIFRSTKINSIQEFQNSLESATQLNSKNFISTICLAGATVASDLARLYFLNSGVFKLPTGFVQNYANDLAYQLTWGGSLSTIAFCGLQFNSILNSNIKNRAYFSSLSDYLIKSGPVLSFLGASGYELTQFINRSNGADVNDFICAFIGSLASYFMINKLHYPIYKGYIETNSKLDEMTEELNFVNEDKNSKN